jgi:hypothetical protein
MNVLRNLDSDDRVMTGAVMTTFPFSPSFFERSVLPALRDKNVGETVAILVDADYYEETFEQSRATELGPESRSQRLAVGQRYQLAPVALAPRRAFHPKIHFLGGKRRVQATVASANLTHPGLTYNREIATQVHVEANVETDENGEANNDANLPRGEQATICRDIAGFLTKLVDSSFGQSIDPVTEGAIERTLAAGEWLADIDTPPRAEQSTRFLHTLDGPVLSQARDAITERGERIQQVDIATPFYGSSLRVPQGFTDEGIETQVWLQDGRTQIPVDALADWLDEPAAKARSYEASRYVHGKVIVVRTDEGAYCLSGSPNASQAALLSAATEGGNIEAALLRRVPDPDHFEYLFETSPFAGCEPVDVASFDPGISLDGVGDEDHNTTAEETAPTLALHGISYQRRESYDGGALTVTGTAAESIQETINDEGAELLVTVPDGNGNPAVVRLQPYAFEWDETGELSTFEASTDRYGDAAERPFIRTASARLRSGNHTSSLRWVQTHTPATGEPAAADITDAGAETVPRAITELYQGDDERRTTVIDSLDGLLSALRETGRNSGETDDTYSEESEGPAGGLRVRPWKQSTKPDPESLIESFYDGWKSDLSEFIQIMKSGRYHFEEVEIRLRAINAATLQLLLLDEARSELDVPQETAISAIKTVYSKRDLQGKEGTSLVADYCAYLHHYAKSSDQTDTVYDGLRTHVLPHVLLATLIAEAHIAGDRETFFQQQGWAFESLIGDCFSNGYPSPENLHDEEIDRIASSIHDAIDGVQTRVEQSRRLRRYTSTRYTIDEGLRRAIIELLGRSILFAGSEAVESYRTDSPQEIHVESVFEEFAVHLPDNQRRQTERWL